MKKLLILGLVITTSINAIKDCEPTSKRVKIEQLTTKEYKKFLEAHRATFEEIYREALELPERGIKRNKQKYESDFSDLEDLRRKRTRKKHVHRKPNPAGAAGAGRAVRKQKLFSLEFARDHFKQRLSRDKKLSDLRNRRRMHISNEAIVLENKANKKEFCIKQSVALVVPIKSQAIPENLLTDKLAKLANSILRLAISSDLTGIISIQNCLKASLERYGTGDIEKDKKNIAIAIKYWIDANLPKESKKYAMTLAIVEHILNVQIV